MPTVGRLLTECLESILACQPAPGELLVVSHGPLGMVLPPAVRLIEQSGPHVSTKVNVGLRAAAHDLVLVTHDDCTVRSDWVGAALRLAQELPGALVSGQVLPLRDDVPIPSCRATDERVEYDDFSRRG